MPKVKLTEEETKIRQTRAQEWSKFRENKGFSQKMLADTLKAIDTENPGKCPGVSRRTVQQIEAGQISPHRHTLDLFAELKRRHSQNGKAA